MISKQSLINKLALSLSKDECSDAQANNIVEFISSLNKTAYDDVKICKLKGVDFKKGIILDFEVLFDSGEEHVYAVEHYVAENMLKLIKKEKELSDKNNHDLFHIKNKIGEEKNQLIKLFEEVGYTTVNRKALLWISGAKKADSIHADIHSNSLNDFSAFVDIRVSEDNYSVELFYPDRLHDSLMNKLGLAEANRNPTDIKILDVQVIPTAIPGLKDAIDYDRILDLRKKHNQVELSIDNSPTM